MEQRSDIAVASFRRYSDAVSVRSQIVDDGFPLSHTGVVGAELTLVPPRRPGPLRLAVAVVAGAGWLGLLLAGLAALLDGPVPAAALLGAGFGAGGALLAGPLLSGLRGRSDAGAVRAGRYELWVAADRADELRGRLLRADEVELTVIPARPPGRRVAASPRDPRASADDLLGLASAGKSAGPIS